MRPIVTDQVAWYVGLSVCLSVTLVSPTKTAAPNEMPFGLRTRVDPKNHVLDGGPDPPWEGTVLRGKGASHCKVGTTCGPLCENGWSDRDVVWVLGSDGR